MSDRANPRTNFVAARLKRKLTGIFGSDLRSLAAFRIGIAILILLDLGDRTRDLRAHYTDWGVVPRAALIDLFLDPGCFSFHFMNGTWQWQLMLFVLAGLCALGLLVGYHTRIMTVISWLLLVSLQNRNPLVLQGGDILLRMSLFWAIFLPLGARSSFDRWLTSTEIPCRETEARSILTWATVAVITQSLLVYIFAGIQKTGPEWTEDNTAVYYAMSVDQLTTPLGQRLLEYPELMRVLTYLALRIELFVPLLFLMPIFTGFFRTVAFVVLFGMQMGFAATIRIYLFPWTCVCATLPMLPSAFWNKLSQADHPWSRSVAHSASGCMRSFSTLLRQGALPSPRVTSSRWLNILAAFFLVYVLLWNLGTLPTSLTSERLEFPRTLRWIAPVLRIDQHWDMFAPSPLKDDGWYVIPGILLDGTTVDVFRQRASVTWTKPQLVAYTYENQRWQKYMMNLWSRDFSAFREFYGKYLCRSWNEAHNGQKQLDHFEIYFMREDTLPNREAPPEKVLLWEHYCFNVPGDE
jgi:hypothetical protein